MLMRGEEQALAKEKGGGPRLYDLSRLKHRVSVTEVLAQCDLLGGLRSVRGEWVGPCPLPAHGGDRSNRSAFRAHPERGVWHCMTHCGGGDVVELAARIAGSDYAAAARLLVAVERSWRTAVQRPEETSSRVRFRPYVKQLRLSADHPFLSARGIHAATAQAFEAGWWPLSGFLEGCIGIRLHDVEGRPLGYAGRRVTVDTTRPWRKWKLPSALPKAELLFNWHRARCHVGHGVVVVEGPFDAMRVWQAGYPNVVALLGSTASARQRAVLAGIPRVVVVLDGDDAGRSGAQRLAAALSSVRVVELPNGHDPDDLSDDELHCSLAAHLPRPGSSERKRSSWPRTTKSEEVSM